MDLESTEEMALTSKEGKEVVSLAGMGDGGSKDWIHPFPQEDLGPQPTSHICPPLTCLLFPSCRHTQTSAQVLTPSPRDTGFAWSLCSLPVLMAQPS